jgi:hypothetical protein
MEDYDPCNIEHLESLTTPWLIDQIALDEAAIAVRSKLCTRLLIPRKAIETGKLVNRQDPPAVQLRLYQRFLAVLKVMTPRIRDLKDRIKGRRDDEGVMAKAVERAFNDNLSAIRQIAYWASMCEHEMACPDRKVEYEPESEQEFQDGMLLRSNPNSAELMAKREERATGEERKIEMYEPSPEAGISTLKSS